MDYSPGKDLLKMFDKLGIDLGNCNSNVIEGWFDVDPQLNDFLTWLSSNLTEENVLYTQEIQEYKNYEHEKLLPSPEDYQAEIDIISQKYPGILDISESKFEIECLEDELKMLLCDKSKLDDILQVHKNLHMQEESELVELEKHKIISVSELEQSEQECFKISCSLDELNKKLYDQLVICNEKLLDYECPSTSTCISYSQLNKYYNQYRDIVSYFGLLEKREIASKPELQSAVLTGSKLCSTLFHEKANDSLFKLKQKLFKSIQTKNYKEAIKEQLEAELNFLKNFNVYEVINSLRSKKQFEENIESKSENYGILSSELEILTTEVSEKYIDFPSITLAKKEAKILQKKINGIKEVEKVFMDIFSYHTLLYWMLIINNVDISRSDSFFRSVQNYMSHNLAKCELRIESMNNIIKQYKLYEDIPFEQRCVLLQTLLRLLSTDDEKPDINFLIKFQNEYCSLNNDESLQFHKQICLIKNNHKILKCFLTNGPTSELITFPFKLHEIFFKIDNILNTKKSIVDATVAVWNDAEKQLSQNKWLKYKRQLWMHFLLRPHKAIALIEKIKSELQRMRTNAM